MTVTSTSVSTDATFARLHALAREHSYFFSDIWLRSQEEFGPAWTAEIVDNVVRLFGDEAGGRWKEAVVGYAEFCLDAMRAQKYFEKHGKYQWDRLADIEVRYYENEVHMMRNYLPGMYISHYLWPHHFRLLTFFRQQVLARLPEPPGLFYDVGIGTGMYSRETLRAFPEVRGKGFDISEFSKRFTQNVLTAYGLIDRYEFIMSDIFRAPLPERKADFVVSQEVLEHLEDPQRFCEILFGLTRPGGRAYITAAINAGHSDHIYLFHSPDELRQMLEHVGYRILDGRAEYAYGGKPEAATPCVAGFFCAR